MTKQLISFFIISATLSFAQDLKIVHMEGSYDLDGDGLKEFATVESGSIGGKQKSIKHLSTPLAGRWAPISPSPILSNPQRRHIRPGIQSDLRSPSPISNLQSRFGGPGKEGGSNLQGDALWIHSHRTSPISDLQSPI